jgi:hypothetical protein
VAVQEPLIGDVLAEQGQAQGSIRRSLCDPYGQKVRGAGEGRVGHVARLVPIAHVELDLRDGGLADALEVMFTVCFRAARVGQVAIVQSFRRQLATL